MRLENFKMSDHMSFYEMTTTNHLSLLDENRHKSVPFLKAGFEVASHADVIREHFGKPCLATSGFRMLALNTKIGGSANSQHMKFQAFDFSIYDVPLEDVWEWIWKDSDLKFGQLILEGWKSGSPTWVHYSLGYPYRRADRCGEVMTWSEAEGYHLVDKVNR